MATEIESLWVQADTLFHTNPRKAAECYREILAFQEHNYMALFNLAVLQKQKGNTNAAKGYLAEACEECPSQENREIMRQVFRSMLNGPIDAKITFPTAAAQHLYDHGFFALIDYLTEDGRVWKTHPSRTTPAIEPPEDEPKPKSPSGPLPIPLISMSTPLLGSDSLGSAPSHVEPSVLAPGTVLNGRYELGAMIGGGFSIIHKATDNVTHREVIIKLPDVGHLNPELRAYQRLIARFELECHITALIEHPNVATVYHRGHVATVESTLDINSVASDRLVGQPFMVMAILRGVSLHRTIPIAPARAVKLFSACLEALAIAHKRGIVHKDINPHNLFLADPDWASERLCLLDFGAAQLDPESSEHQHAPVSGIHQSKSIGASGLYTTPEHVRGHTVTAAGDVYQVGLVLLECITGEPPYGVGLDDDPVSEIRNRKAPPPLPAPIANSPLGEIFRKALQPDPEKRFPDAWSLADALKQIPLDTLPTLEEILQTRHLIAPSPRKEERIDLDMFDEESIDPAPNDEEAVTQLIAPTPAAKPSTPEQPDLALAKSAVNDAPPKPQEEPKTPQPTAPEATSTASHDTANADEAPPQNDSAPTPALAPEPELKAPPLPKPTPPRSKRPAHLPPRPGPPPPHHRPSKPRASGPAPQPVAQPPEWFDDEELQNGNGSAWRSVLLVVLLLGLLGGAVVFAFEYLLNPTPPPAKPTPEAVVPPDKKSTDDKAVGSEGIDKEDDTQPKVEATPDKELDFPDENDTSVSEEARKNPEQHKKEIELWRKRQRATLRISAFPPSSVFINGRPRGRTPLRVKLPAGTYNILLQNRELKRAARKRITLARGQHMKVTHTFE